MEEYQAKLEEIRDKLQETMGGELSYCFLKAPQSFIDQISAAVDFFLYNAHEKLMNKINDQLFLAKKLVGSEGYAEV